jgi:hypothetical protein
MIDSRKNKTEYPKTLDQFVKEAEKQGFEVEYKKQTYTKSVLILRKDGHEEKCEFDHSLINGRVFFIKIWKPMIWDFMRKIDKLEAEKREENEY